MALKIENEQIRQLLIRCKKNDRAAQFKIYELYYKAMYNCAYRILRNSYMAEDIMQESFLIAFKKLETIKIKVTFGSWLKRIVINKSLTQLKVDKRIEKVSLDMIKNEDTISIDYNKLNVDEILRAIKKLKSNYCEILTLHLIEGYKHNELSEILNISNENCRTKVSRAKAQLRKILSQ